VGRLRSLRKGYCDDPNFLHETVERVVRQLVEGRGWPSRVSTTTPTRP
jgi:hypothetical protein